MILPCLFDGTEVEAKMFEKGLIFGRDDCQGHVRRYMRSRYPLVMQGVLRAFFIREVEFLQNHKKGYRRWDPSEDEDQSDDGG